MPTLVDASRGHGLAPPGRDDQRGRRDRDHLLRRGPEGVRCGGLFGRADDRPVHDRQRDRRRNGRHRVVAGHHRRGRGLRLRAEFWSGRPRTTQPGAAAPRTPPRSSPTRRSGIGASARRPAAGPAVRSGDPGRGHPASRPEYRRRDGRQPQPGVARSQRPPDHRERLSQPVPVHLPADHERDLGRRRGLEHVGGDQPYREPDRRRRQPRLAVLRGRADASRPTTTSTSASAKGSTRRPRGP